MSHMTVGQLTPDLVMTLKMRSTYCRRFSCNEVGAGHPNSAVWARLLPRLQGVPGSPRGGGVSEARDQLGQAAEGSPGSKTGASHHD